MSVPFPEPTAPVATRADVFLGYLDYFRDRLVSKLASLPEDELRRSRLPSGWTPIELLKHLRYVELRWLEWGFEGRDIGDPWADRRGDRWYVGPDETLAGLTTELATQAARTRAIVTSHDLADAGAARRALGRRRPGVPGARPVPPAPGVRPAHRPPRHRHRTSHRPDRRIAWCGTIRTSHRQDCHA